MQRGKAEKMDRSWAREAVEKENRSGGQERKGRGDAHDRNKSEEGRLERESRGDIKKRG